MRSTACPAKRCVQAAKLAGMFVKNFEQYASGVTAAVCAVGPKI